ncbi:MAG: ATP-binding protein, partial [Candidatus Oxydemutatoraceae bacterium WSBS_2016_MAG_OTU14]
QKSTHLQKLWMRGGFPSSYQERQDVASHQWRQNFIRTYLERDIPQLGPRIAASTLMRFWTMLSHAHSELFNASKLACALGVASVTVSRYLDLMVDILLVRRLTPWHGNVKKRLVKSPRTYIRDSGILHALLHIQDYEQLLGHPIVGKSWEGFVIENIISILPPHVQAFFYRTTAGAEIDLLLEINLNEYWAVEIKASRTVNVKKGFHIACEDLGIKHKFVVYMGEDTFPLGQETTVMSLPLFMQAVRKHLS